MFFKAQGNLLLCKISGFNDTFNRFFGDRYYNFDNKNIETFAHNIFAVFFLIRIEIFKFGSKLSKQ